MFVAAVASTAAIVATGVGLPTVARAASVSGAVFSDGGNGAVAVGGTVYARNGGALTLTVTTSSDARCVDVTGALTAHQTSFSPKRTWTINLTAGTGDGSRTVTAAAWSSFSGGGGGGACNGSSSSPQSASFVLDNTAPVLTPAVSPAPNAAGWNHANTTISWTASDAGSGIASGPTPATDTVTADTAATGVTRTATATDRLGNSGSGSVTVKLDKGVPAITGSRTPAPNADGWNNGDVTVSFTCADSLAGIKSCSPPTSLTTSAAGQSVTGTAVDNADNSATATIGAINIDKVAPTLSGAPTAPANAGGWYSGDVTIHWTAADALSGLTGPAPADDTLTGEGDQLTASASVSDKAGNTTTASSPVVKIDRTAPNTLVTAPANWTNTAVTVTLDPADALSGVAATYWTLDGGEQQSGTSVPIADEGTHTLTFFSVDKAGNAEAARTAEVRIDKTAPTIFHTLDPLANGNGWNNAPVTVTFSCDDADSGIASCTPPQQVTAEGKDQAVTGTATDNAGNTATDPATVSVDLTAPTATAAADRLANANGWYNDDVTVSFTCADALSGVDVCPGASTLGEGADQLAGAEVLDAADNTVQAELNGINVDKTAPTLTGAATTAPNGNGWYAGDVTVHWTCDDALSGVDGGCPADATLTGEGADLSASATVTDKAGNATSATVTGVKIDRTAPSTGIDLGGKQVNGWFVGGATVTLSGVDWLSGVAHTAYAVDGGAFVDYTGPFAVAQGGTHHLTWYSTDRAGNVEASQSKDVTVDDGAPTITGTRTPVGNVFGWVNGPVTVSFACADAESGIAGCTDPVTVATEGAGQSVDGTATDLAGNTASTTVGGIDIDLTAPQLSGAATTAPNAAGWYAGDVTVHWTGLDGLSGIDPATQPADSVVTGEGADLGAGPVTVADKAGNVATASVAGLRIDRTPPTIAGAATTTPNPAGWYGGAVTVHYTCADALSGVADCPGDAVISGDGKGQAVSGTATDSAGNTAATTVSGIDIDGTAPASTANNRCSAGNGWCTGGTATVDLAGTDNLSGVKELHYRVNGGDEQVVAGATASVDVPLTGSGQATISYFAVDNADNAEPVNTETVKYDGIAPTVTHTQTPAPNADGWNTGDVTVTFAAKDDDPGSGLDPAGVTPPVTITAETAGTDVVGTAKDLAGNVGTDTVTVRLDRTTPSVSGAVISGVTGANGWYRSAVRVAFSCWDGLSGVAGCPAPVDLLDNGAGQQAVGTATDWAGNKATSTVGGIAIDAVAPTITATGYTPGAHYTLGAVPKATCTATDTTSGVASCTVTVAGPSTGVGTFTYRATATDKAGNAATSSGSFVVVYRFDGFGAPIGVPGQKAGAAPGIFRAGCLIPVKVQLKRADGSVVKGTAPVFVAPAKGARTTAKVNRSGCAGSPTKGSTFSWDARSQQWTYTWNTKGLPSGYLYTIGARLGDGTTAKVTVGLR